MPTPILATKLYIPAPRDNAVARPRLIERLDEGLQRKLTLISAPAGFGKSTLLSEWVAGCEQPAAWLTLDDADNDPIRFLSYLVAALQTIAPEMGEGVVAALRSPEPPNTESIVTVLLNEIADLPNDFILVLDDFHVIEAKPVEATLAFLFEHLPSQLHLVIATREDPDLPLARLRARGQLTELRASHLRFTASEAAKFLNEVMGFNLTLQHIGALEARTEGWIAGLQLAALALQGTISMQGEQDVAGFIESFAGSHHFVMDYLVEEVLHQQPERIRNFLLSTSILARLSGPLCDAVVPSGSTSGQEVLEFLDRANLLIVPLDDERKWYRYHQLFAEVLRARLIQEQPAQVADLHRRASAWFEQNDLRADAIGHALAAEDFEHAADLIELDWSANSGRYFQSATWLGWMKALPDELVRTRPKLSLGFVWELLFHGELEAAEARMRNVDRALKRVAGNQDATGAATTSMNEEEARSLRATLALARAFHAQALGDVAGTVEHAQTVLTLVSDANHYMRGLANSLLGLAGWSEGDMETASMHLGEALTSLRAAGNLLFATSCAFVLADIRIAQGRLFEAARIYEEALQIATARGEPVVQGTADLHLGLSELKREQGHVSAAREHLLSGERLGKPAALPEWPYGLYLVQARIQEDQGDMDSALRLLEEAEDLYIRSPVPDVRPIAARKTRVWIRQGRLTEALDWARRHALSVDDDLSYQREFEHVTLARLLIARHESDPDGNLIEEAVRLLERLLEAAEQGARTGSVIEILVLQARAHWAVGKTPLALAALERALTLAEPEGYIRVFLDEGDSMAELLGRLDVSIESGPSATGQAVRRYVRQLIAAFERRDQASPTSSRGEPLIEPLSRRELEVLRLIAEGLSNYEIGERLFLALSTVKGHNRNIFDKLQVRRRTEAVARARELGLLEPDR